MVNEKYLVPMYRGNFTFLGSHVFMYKVTVSNQPIMWQHHNANNTDTGKG